MPVTLIDGPAAVVTLDAVKAHLQITTAKDDAVLGGMLLAAQAAIDGPAGTLNRAIGTQTLRASGLDWPCDGLMLPYGFVQSVQDITLSGVPIPSTGFKLGDDGLLRGSGWPWWTSVGGPVITWTAGYALNKVPAPITTAILLMVQDLYAKRSRDPSLTVDTVVNVSSQQFASTGSSTLTDTAKALLAPFKLWSL